MDSGQRGQQSNILFVCLFIYLQIWKKELTCRVLHLRPSKRLQAGTLWKNIYITLEKGETGTIRWHLSQPLWHKQLRLPDTFIMVWQQLILETQWWWSSEETEWRQIKQLWKHRRTDKQQEAGECNPMIRRHYTLKCMHYYTHMLSKGFWICISRKELTSNDGGFRCLH